MSKDPRRRAHACGAALLAAATVVAGCASAEPSRPASATSPPPIAAPTGTAPASTASASTAQATTRHGCAVVPAGVVGAALGEPTGGPRQFDLGHGVTQCVYGTDVSQPAVLRFYNDANASIFAKLKSLARTGPDQHVTNVTFEDEAFFIASTGKGITVNELVARRASLIIFVVSSASLQAEETLGHQIFAMV